MTRAAPRIGPQARPQSADHHHRDQEQEQRQAEDIGADHAKMPGEDAAREPGEEGRHGEHQELVLEAVEAARDAVFGIVAKRPEGESERASDHDERKDRRQREQEKGQIVVALQIFPAAEHLAEAEIAEFREPPRAAGEIPAGHAFHVEAGGVGDDQEIHHLGDRESQKRHIGPAQPEAGEADQNTEQDRADPGERQRGPEREAEIERQHPGREAAEREDRHLREREDAGNAEHQVPLGDHGRPDEEQRELADQIARRPEKRDRDHDRDEDRAEGGVAPPVRPRLEHQTRRTTRRPNTP